MTTHREELNIERRLWKDYRTTHPDAPDIGELFDALEAAWVERDKLVAASHHEPDYKILRAALDNMEKERDTALKEGLVLTIKVQELEEEVERLKLGYRGFP